MTPIILTLNQPRDFMPPPSYISYSSGPSIPPIRVQACWRYQSPSFRPSPILPAPPKPLPLLLALQEAGIHPAEGSWILYQLTKDNDTPYHAALLMNGKACVVSQNDRVFYGKPGKLKPLPVVDAWRTKCPNEQTRYLKTDSGLEITIHAENGLKRSLVKRRLTSRFSIPLNSKAEARLPAFTKRLTGQTITA